MTVQITGVQGGAPFGKTASKTLVTKDVSADVFSVTKTAGAMTFHLTPTLGEGDPLKTQFDAEVAAGAF